MKRIIECHDCGKKIEEKGKELVGAKLLIYKYDDKKVAIIKCDECFKKDPSLTNFRKTEVYSRVVGYLRPINQWNVGKQEEYKDRVNFKMTTLKTEENTQGST
ncbi:MAG: anaerobic ribonucleoside-triphosphate reductase [Methanogenium sp.]|jgi:hypothetical protein